MFSWFEHVVLHRSGLVYAWEYNVVLNGHLPWVFLALKNTSPSLEAFQPSYLAGISLELHLVAAWPYKPHWTCCEDPVQSISVHFIKWVFRRSRPLRSGQLHFGQLHFSHPNTSVFGNRCRLTPSLVLLLQPAATHLDGIMKNNQLQTWQKISLIPYQSINSTPAHPASRGSIQASMESTMQWSTHAGGSVCLKADGDRRFPVMAPRLWKGLPITLKIQPDVVSFKRQRKPHIFNQTFQQIFRCRRREYINM